MSTGRDRLRHLSPAIVRGTGYALAAIVAAATILVALRSSADMPPFGWPRLVLVHAVLVLPLCGWLAQSMLRISTRQAWRRFAGACVIGGLALVGADIFVLPAFAHTLDTQAAGFVALLIARSAMSLTLELPWCIAIEALLARRDIPPVSDRLAFRPANACWGVVALCVALALPAAYTSELCRRQAMQATDLLRRQKVVAAERIVLRLAAVDSTEMIGDAAPREVANSLRHAIVRLERGVQQPALRPLDPPSTLERARALAMLDRLAEAEDVLEPLAATNADASLLLAAILQDQRRYDESTRWYRAAAQLSAAMPPAADVTARHVRAIGGVAFNARETGRYAEAEAAYLQGLAEMPDAAASFHFQLGRHYQAAGRPVKAIEHLEQAALLAPAQFAAQAADIRRQLALETPGCLLGRSGWKGQLPPEQSSE